MTKVTLKEIATIITNLEVNSTLKFVGRGMDDTLGKIDNNNFEDIGVFYITKTDKINFANTLIVFGNNCMTSSIPLDDYWTPSKKEEAVYNDLINFFYGSGSGNDKEWNEFYLLDTEDSIEDLEKFIDTLKTFDNISEEDFWECFEGHRGSIPNKANSNYQERTINLYLPNIEYDKVSDVIKSYGKLLKDCFNNLHVEDISTDLDDSDDEYGLLFFDIKLSKDIKKDELRIALNNLSNKL